MDVSGTTIQSGTARLLASEATYEMALKLKISSNIPLHVNSGFLEINSLLARHLSVRITLI